MAAKAMTTAVRKARLFGSGGNINLIAAKLHRHKERLKSSLNKRGRELQPEVRKEYEGILKKLTISSALVAGIRCQGPFMSLDLPKSKVLRPARRARARRRR
jgi:predicted  nucleic acid-binding Zn-ribbon protein